MREEEREKGMERNELRGLCDKQLATYNRPTLILFSSATHLTKKKREAAPTACALLGLPLSLASCSWYWGQYEKEFVGQWSWLECQWSLVPNRLGGFLWDTKTCPCGREEKEGEGERRREREREEMRGGGRKRRERGRGRGRGKDRERREGEEKNNLRSLYLLHSLHNYRFLVQQTKRLHEEKETNRVKCSAEGTWFVTHWSLVYTDEVFCHSSKIFPIMVPPGDTITLSQCEDPPTIHTFSHTITAVSTHFSIGQSSAFPLKNERFFFPVRISHTMMFWGELGSSTIVLKVTKYLWTVRWRG